MPCGSLWPSLRSLAGWALPPGSVKLCTLEMPRAPVMVARWMKSSSPRFGVG